MNEQVKRDTRDRLAEALWVANHRPTGTWDGDVTRAYWQRRANAILAALPSVGLTINTIDPSHQDRPFRLSSGEVGILSGPTETQAVILRRMVRGAALGQRLRRGALRWVLYPEPDRLILTSVRAATVSALNRAGWLVERGDHMSGYLFEISRAGLDALQSPRSSSADRGTR